MSEQAPSQPPKPVPFLLYRGVAAAHRETEPIITAARIASIYCTAFQLGLQLGLEHPRPATEILAEWFAYAGNEPGIGQAVVRQALDAFERHVAHREAQSW